MNITCGNPECEAEVNIPENSIFCPVCGGDLKNFGVNLAEIKKKNDEAVALYNQVRADGNRYMHTRMLFFLLLEVLVYAGLPGSKGPWSALALIIVAIFIMFAVAARRDKKFPLPELPR